MSRRAQRQQPRLPDPTDATARAAVEKVEAALRDPKDRDGARARLAVEMQDAMIDGLVRSLDEHSKRINVLEDEMVHVKNRLQDDNLALAALHKRLAELDCHAVSEVLGQLEEPDDSGSD